MTRLLRVIGLAAVIGVVSGGSAAAVPPERHFLPAPEGAVVEGICDFPVEAHFPANNEFEMVFFDQDGNVTKIIITGKLFVELTNLDDPEETLSANISGAGVITFDNDSVLTRAVGSWALFFFPGQLGEGHPGMFLLTHGQVVLRDHPDGTTDILKMTGTQQDVCEALSP